MEHPPLPCPDLLPFVLFRDALVIVLNKPAGIAVHPGPSGGPSLEDGFDALRFGYKETPRLAHRLDRDTSGCLVLGRNDRALRKLGKLFESGRIEKTYLAVTDRPPPAPAGTIHLALRKVKKPKGWSMEPAPPSAEGAQDAVTDYRILGLTADGGTLIELSPKTGRTHQIRVHLASLGCPIRGDWLYGPGETRPETFDRLALHAARITLPLYPDKAPVSISAPPPAFMHQGA